MDDDEQVDEVQSPLQRAVVSAFIASFLSLLVVYGVVHPVVELIQVGWVGWLGGLACAIVPIVVTFVILYRSCWHQEIIGVARTCSVFLLSSAILVGVLFATGFMLVFLSFCYMAVSGGNH